MSTITTSDTKATKSKRQPPDYDTFVCVIRGETQELADIRSVLRRIADERGLPLHRIYLQAMLDFIAADNIQSIPDITRDEEVAA